MFVSRSLEELQPRVNKKARQLLELCHESDIDLMVVCTYRDNEMQQWMYESGRERTGPILTYTRPGWSYHNWRMAFDVCPLLGGRPIWHAKGRVQARLWKLIIELGKSVGLESGSDFRAYKREYGHFQLTEGLSIHDLMDGKRLK